MVGEDVNKHEIKIYWDKQVATLYHGCIYECDYKGKKCYVQQTHNEQYDKQLVDIMTVYGCQSERLVSLIDYDKDNGYIIIENAGVTLKTWMSQNIVNVHNYQQENKQNKQNYQSDDDNTVVIMGKYSSVNERKTVIKNLAECLLVLENMGIYHKYLSDDNIWINPKTLDVKVSDYGIDYSYRQPVDWCIKHYNPFMCVEVSVNEYQSYNLWHKEDTWCFAMLAFGILIQERQTTYGFRHSNFDYYSSWLLSPSLPIVLSRCCNSAPLQHIIKMCLTWPLSRPSMADIYPDIVKI